LLHHVPPSIPPRFLPQNEILYVDSVIVNIQFIFYQRISE
jgi:hypothetical protein